MQGNGFGVEEQLPLVFLMQNWLLRFARGASHYEEDGVELFKVYRLSANPQLDSLLELH